MSTQDEQQSQSMAAWSIIAVLILAVLGAMSYIFGGLAP